MVAWNPSSPRLIGLELGRFDYLAPAVAAASHVQAFRFRAAASGTVDSARLFLDGGASMGPAGLDDVQRWALAEVVPLGSEAHGLIQATEFACNAVVASSLVTTTPALETPVACLATPGDGKSLLIDAGGSFQAEFATAGFTDGKQVLAVQFVLRHDYLLELWPAVYPAGTAQTDSVFASNRQAMMGPALADFGEARQDTGAVYAGPWQVWNPAEVREFDAGTRRLYVQVPAGYPTAGLGSLTMRVWWCPERRLACGMAAPVANDWVAFPLTTPAARAAWSRVSGTDYTLLLRRPGAWGHKRHAEASVPWRMLAGGALPLDALNRRRTLTVGGEADRFQPVDAADATDLPCVRLVTGGADLPESNPYLGSWGALVAASTLAKQRLSIPDTTARPLLYAWVSSDLATAGTSLTVRVRRVADSVVMATATVGATELAAALETSPGWGGSSLKSQAVTYRRVRVDLGTFALSAQLYDLEFECAAATVSAPWLVAFANLVNTYTSTAGSETYSYGGATQYAPSSLFYIGTPGVAYAVTGDLGAALSARPAAPSTVTATATVVTTSGDNVPGATVGWAYNASLPTAEFSYVEVQRSDVAGGEWLTIARLYNIGQLSFVDVEGRIGTPSTYRVRNVRTDGAASDWVTPAAVTPPAIAAAASGCALTFTTNANRGLSVAADDVGSGAETPDRDYQLPEADELVLVALYGRNYRAAFRPTERRGVTFQRLLLLRSGAAPAPSITVFAPLTYLATATIPYVCVRDSDGNRWFAAIAVPEAVDGRVAHTYLATVSVAEVADTPAVAAA